jgi:hypothetical protein
MGEVLAGSESGTFQMRHQDSNDKDHNNNCCLNCCSKRIGKFNLQTNFPIQPAFRLATGTQSRCQLPKCSWKMDCLLTENNEGTNLQNLL